MNCIANIDFPQADPRDSGLDEVRKYRNCQTFPVMHNDQQIGHFKFIIRECNPGTISMHWCGYIHLPIDLDSEHPIQKYLSNTPNDEFKIPMITFDSNDSHNQSINQSPRVIGWDHGGRDYKNLSGVIEEFKTIWNFVNTKF
ncbi:hypothetical protein QLL95_gp0619 [Cotonvirus japonicus]|uniref:Uncharacterized protein n=1 Tax=Cotonvirus japonicus TaxID=2811091 RepID=A0ABM7NTL1_9VIRU|nr:hypothetical protein QLL95_gp0619 [Cotonvirus japonicus]BCS83504.1 hypothetical protein [Cotonvirus japonicus]